ncbi:MAG TPA: metal-sensing transcriptional repressor [Gemmatimonadaceae bacterium]|nr:metal-sensing transcriptional repressor [Gemmatimonadaceae bacterium]
MRPSARKKSLRSEKRRAATQREGRSLLPTMASPVDDLYLTGDAERAIYNRLSRLEGQVRGVKKMLAEHKSCDEMLVQISALKQAVNGVAAELLQAHMETCVLGRIEAGEGERALTSLRNALAKVMKHG